MTDLSRSERMTFPGGWWADIRTAWPYGADTRIAAAWTFMGDTDAFERACRVTLQESVPAANLPDVDGNAVPFGPEMWETVDGRLGRKVLKRCRQLWGAWQKDSDPKGTGSSSSASVSE